MDVVVLVLSLWYSNNLLSKFHLEPRNFPYVVKKNVFPLKGSNNSTTWAREMTQQLRSLTD